MPSGTVDYGRRPTISSPPSPSGGGVGDGRSVLRPGTSSSNSNVLPATPSSTESTHRQSPYDTHAAPSDGSERQQQHKNVDGSDPKRPRACEACRGLKVRCEPDEDAHDDQAPCKRCRKANRRCFTTAPSRKRARKTDSRVSELEKKIDALSASLQARAAAGPSIGFGAGVVSTGESPDGGEGETGTVPASKRTKLSSSMDGSGDLQSYSQGSMAPTRSFERGSVAPAPMGRDQPPAFPAPGARTATKRKASDRQSTVEEETNGSPKLPPLPSPWGRPDQGDIVDRNIISMDLAADLFVRYTEYLAPHLPIVVFPPSMTAAELRRSKPMLFLAVMCAAISDSHTLQVTLQREIMTVFAEKVFLSGEKTLELVQALLVTVSWYWPVENQEELKFYQLIHIAGVVAIDIGLGRKASPRRAGSCLRVGQGNTPFRRSGVSDPATIECRRTWLGCYFLACNTSISLHRPSLIRWTSFMTESLDILESSLDAAPTDKYFCHLVQQHRLGEDIGGQFSLDDPSNMVDINDARTQYSLKALERDLEKIHKDVPEDLKRPTLMIGHNMINLYLHEVALHTKTAVDQIRPPFHPDTFKDGVVGTSEPLSTAHIGAISACIAAVEGIFTTFLSMDVRDIRCLPVYNFVRVAYGVVILVKMYFSASSQGSELGKVIDKGTLRVEQYLDALLDKFRQTANGDGSRPAAKFRFVLGMLRSWLLKQDGRYEGRNGERGRSMRSGSSGVSAAESSSQQQPQPQQQQSANTPLQLLSEVASNSDASRTRAAYFSVVDGIRQPSQTFFHDSTATPTAATSTELQQQQQQQPAAFPDTSSSWATSPQQQQQPPGLPMDMTGLSASGLGMTPAFPSMGGFAPVPEDEDGARFVISEPWFTDVFQGFQGFQEDTTMFPF